MEGETDKSVIPYLMEANGVPWPDPPDYPLYIAAHGSVDEILKPEVIEAELRASGLEALGVIVDADGDAGARWNQLRTWCGGEFDGLPDRVPVDGLSVVHAGGPRFGIWIMPDDRFTGMLEDFLVQLVPAESRDLYEAARRCVAESRRHGASFRDAHTRKAELHTWLAWQDPPGARLHEAVDHRALDPSRPESLLFVNWFRNFFGV